MAQLIFTLVIKTMYQYTLYVCIQTMPIHSAYLVSDLEGSDNCDPINGIIYCLGAVNHGLDGCPLLSPWGVGSLIKKWHTHWHTHDGCPLSSPWGVASLIIKLHIHWHTHSLFMPKVHCPDVNLRCRQRSLRRGLRGPKT